MAKSNPSPSAEFYRADAYQPGESMGWLIRRIQQTIVCETGKRLADHGLTHAQWMPLVRLHFNGNCPAAQLAGDLGLDAGALTRMLDRLEAKGLVSRERSSNDRRVVMIALTEEGRRITDKLPAVLSEVFNAHLAGFSHQEWQTLMGLLQRVLANGEALRQNDRPNDESSR